MDYGNVGHWDLSGNSNYSTNFSTAPFDGSATSSTAPAASPASVPASLSSDRSVLNSSFNPHGHSGQDPLVHDENVQVERDQLIREQDTKDNAGQQPAGGDSSGVSAAPSHSGSHYMGVEENANRQPASEDSPGGNGQYLPSMKGVVYAGQNTNFRPAVGKSSNEYIPPKHTTRSVKRDPKTSAAVGLFSSGLEGPGTDLVPYWEEHRLEAIHRRRLASAKASAQITTIIKHSWIMRGPDWIYMDICWLNHDPSMPSNSRPHHHCSWEGCKEEFELMRLVKAHFIRDHIKKDILHRPYGKEGSTRLDDVYKDMEGTAHWSRFWDEQKKRISTAIEYRTKLVFNVSDWYQSRSNAPGAELIVEKLDEWINTIS